MDQDEKLQRIGDLVARMKAVEMILTAHPYDDDPTLRAARAECLMHVAKGIDAGCRWARLVRDMVSLPPT